MFPDSTQAKKDLLAAAEAAVAPRHQGSARAGNHATGSRSRLLTSGLTLLALLGTYIFVLRPDWVITTLPVAEAPEISEASMRLALVRERQRVETFLREHDQLPRSLAEAGGRLPGATLVAADERRFAIAIQLDGKRLELWSTDSLETFLGNSLEVILSRPRD